MVDMRLRAPRGEHVCPACEGTGLVGRKLCRECGGTGRIIDAPGPRQQKQERQQGDPLQFVPLELPARVGIVALSGAS